LPSVKKQLNKEHFGLSQIKERILEHVAVLKLTQEKQTPILCLVGPPGVGKTTLGRSIAEALGREFVRISLGGIRDEAEIRGHRRTYVGSMPGKIIQGIKRAKVMNPVILLDEIDKMANDFRGDPASALLELLDPEQNSDFTDNFLEIGVDLSKVLFITTANIESSIPEPLRDRLEILRLSGYHSHEKLAIAQKHLVPKRTKSNGLSPTQIQLNDEAVYKIIHDYTREAGVRSLEKEIDKIMRKRAVEVVSKKVQTKTIIPAKLQHYLGIPRFSRSQLIKKGEQGLVTGLAWTSVGGEILQIECALMEGKGKLKLTGTLGDVMKESAQIALTLAKKRIKKLGIDPKIFNETDIHIHLPEGAIPKDGPSAGIGLTLSILSAFCNKTIDPKIAFTGEVSLSGKLHAIGGLPEKSIAALEAGVTKIMLPKENAKDVTELPPIVKKGVKIERYEHIDEIIKKLF
jgi:ATP-dependent Lon protease